MLDLLWMIVCLGIWLQFAQLGYVWAREWWRRAFDWTGHMRVVVGFIALAFPPAAIAAGTVWMLSYLADHSSWFDTEVDW